MNFSFATKPRPNLPIIFPIFFQKKKFLKSGLKPFDDIIERAIQIKIFEGNPGETYSHTSERTTLPKYIVFVSLGDPKKVKHRTLLGHLAQAVRLAKKEKSNTLSIYVPKELSSHGQAVAEALVLTNYDPARFKTGKAAKKRKEHKLSSCTFIGRLGSKFRDATTKGNSIAEAVTAVREIVNGPPNIVTPDFLEEEVLKFGKQFGYTVQVLKKKALEKLGMNAILAVNRGSKKEARLLILEYHPPKTAEGSVKENSQPVVLVGKGIVFDSGGYNLKPSGYIENMHLDMAGAGSVFGVFRLLKKLGVPFPVIGLAPITENVIGSDSYKPSEIIKTFGGKTVEITNTDAEGRLVLCDALAYAVKQYKPKYLIDLATLTGACMVALGERYAGLFGNDKELMKLLRKAGNETDELVWPLPLSSEFDEAMKGEITDLQNAEVGRYGGASKAAAFLKAFVGKTKWAHLDIAGPAYVTNPKKYESKRGTGYGVRLIIKFLEYLAQAS